MSANDLFLKVVLAVENGSENRYRVFSQPDKPEQIMKFTLTRVSPGDKETVDLGSARIDTEIVFAPKTEADGMTIMAVSPRFGENNPATQEKFRRLFNLMADPQNVFEVNIEAIVVAQYQSRSRDGSSVVWSGAITILSWQVKGGMRREYLIEPLPIE